MAVEELLWLSRLDVLHTMNLNHWRRHSSKYERNRGRQPPLDGRRLLEMLADNPSLAALVRSFVYSGDTENEKVAKFLASTPNLERLTLFNVDSPGSLDKRHDYGMRCSDDDILLPKLWRLKIGCSPHFNPSLLLCFIAECRPPIREFQLRDPLDGSQPHGSRFPYCPIILPGEITENLQYAYASLERVSISMQNKTWDSDHRPEDKVSPSGFDPSLPDDSDDETDEEEEEISPFEPRAAQIFRRKPIVTMGILPKLRFLTIFASLLDTNRPSRRVLMDLIKDCPQLEGLMIKNAHVLSAPALAPLFTAIAMCQFPRLGKVVLVSGWYGAHCWEQLKENLRQLYLESG
ncbi:hypothetical protein B0H63DRAFT_554266 [Podospora didyma]|uniref:Uncharacterized protein n=1 Tax=Podospora didyma TaxID=330526 RepID=A0AAE0U6U4_9PEZI|nr:hypothetical protein B0H63DRAFT_554266 [Podospora didyma]